jgi:hypothetical protein
VTCLHRTDMSMCLNTSSCHNPTRERFQHHQCNCFETYGMMLSRSSCRIGTNQPILSSYVSRPLLLISVIVERCYGYARGESNSPLRQSSKDHPAYTQASCAGWILNLVPVGIPVNSPRWYHAFQMTDPCLHHLGQHG